MEERPRVTVRARPARGWILLGGLGPGMLLVSVGLLGFDAWLFARQTARLDVLGLALVGGIALIVLIALVPEALWRTHAFTRFVAGRLWFTVHAAGFETGWDGLHTWSQLLELRLAPWLYTGGRGLAYATWLLEYRLRGTRRREILDLAVFGTPGEVAGQVAPVLADHGVVDARTILPRTWWAALRWLLPARPTPAG